MGSYGIYHTEGPQGTRYDESPSAGTKVVYYPSNLRLYKLRMIRTFVQPKASLGLVKLFYKCKLQGHCTVVCTTVVQLSTEMGGSSQVFVSNIIGSSVA